MFWPIFLVFLFTDRFPDLFFGILFGNVYPYLFVTLFVLVLCLATHFPYLFKILFFLQNPYLKPIFRVQISTTPIFREMHFQRKTIDLFCLGR